MDMTYNFWMLFQPFVGAKLFLEYQQNSLNLSGIFAEKEKPFNTAPSEISLARKTQWLQHFLQLQRLSSQHPRPFLHRFHQPKFLSKLHQRLKALHHHNPQRVVLSSQENMFFHPETILYME